MVTGYNCQQINELRDVINNTAQQAATGIVDRLHSSIIVPISSAWYAPEAVEFFSGVAETVKAAGEGITSAFDTFRAAIQEAGARWAENTGGETPSLPAIDPVELNLNVSEIQPDNNGNVTIDESAATSIASSLGEVEEGIKSDLENIAGNLNAETAFIGHGQASALQDCFVRLSNEIHKIFKFLTDGEESLQVNINRAVEKYGEVSTSISDEFNSSVTE